MIAAAERLADSGERRVGLLFLVGEENGSDGAQAAADLGPKGRFLINGEPTENRLSIGQKGSLRVDLAATGRAAHSAYPDEGDQRDRGAARHDRADPPAPAARATRCSGAPRSTSGSSGAASRPTSSPADASAQLLIRIVEPTGPLRSRIRELAAPRCRGDASRSSSPSTRADRRPAGWETTVVSYASDLPFLASWGEGYQLGPGTIRVAHTAGSTSGRPICSRAWSSTSGSPPTCSPAEAA